MKAIFSDLGLTHYNDTWNIQKVLHKNKQNNKSLPDYILSTQHYPVYTLGKTGEREHLLLDEKQLKEKKIEYFETDRGGDITYHGPGQIVIYPIMDLENHYRDVHRFLRELEETVILTLSEYNIAAHREEEFTGVWVGNEKICAIGIKVSRWITMHGLAFNITNDLSYFDKIIPCGIFHKGVTSMKKLLNRELNINEITEVLLNNFLKVFKIDAQHLDKDYIRNKIKNDMIIS